MSNYEILNEITITTSSNYHMKIDVDFSDKMAAGFVRDPYFKVYDSENRAKGSKIARISIYRPEYVYHKNGYDKTSAGKDDFKLSKQEISFMIQMLKSPFTINRVPYKSAWEGMCELIRDYGISQGIIARDDMTTLKNVKMPDYTQLAWKK